ncbi:DUF4229 domain-containing protein [Kitasatospora xanthocidica]|uniref:DUF4229 domain-containing protein n=1 Tax=Kitasatospora xanthocidica TaxID=83382 RepID=UPI0036E2E42A
MSSNGPAKSHATLRYTSMRVSIFLGCLLVALLLGHFQVIPVSGQAGMIFLFLLAAVASAPLSYALLGKQRDEMSAQISDKVAGMRTRNAERDAMEDAADDAARAASAKN